MELKTARLTLLIDPNKKAAFERLCAEQDRTPSQVVRQLIRDYLAHYGVAYQGSGAPDTGIEPPDTAAPPSPPPGAEAPTAAAPARPAPRAADGNTQTGA